MKKLLSILLTMTLVLSFNSTLTFTANNVTEEAFAMAEDAVSKEGNYDN